MGDEIYTRNMITTYKTFESMTNFSAKTTSIGLPGLFSTCRFIFAAQSRQFYHDKTPSYHLPVPIAIGIAKTAPATGQLIILPSRYG